MEDILLNIASSLARIADRLEAMPIPAPDHTFDLSDYPQFDWASIGAEIIARDKHGATLVRHSGKVYSRRSPLNKYGVAIWYSRATGKDENGDTHYERLATFKEISYQVDPLPEKTIARLQEQWT